MNKKMFGLIVIECLLLILTTALFAPVGYLGIEVEPEGSTLFLDGNFIGHSPMYLAFITPRHYKLEIGKVAADDEGISYKGITSNLYVGRFKKTMTNYTLEPLYSFVIRSNPAGATVTIDGKVQENITPCRISNLSEGKHELILDLANYPSVRHIIDTTETTENILLDFDSTHSLFIESNPQDAQVLVDGIIVGRTPCYVEGLEMTTHTFELSLNGYKTIKKDVDLKSKGNKLSFTFEKIPNLEEIP